jgi:general secretion pathway protein G
MISFRRQSLKPGFSITELVFYMLIVGLLMAVAGAGISSAMKTAKKSTTESSLRAISQAIDVYYSSVQPNRYPETLDDLVTAPEGVKGWDGPYVTVREVDGEKHVPLDGWKQEFQYERTPGGAHPYELYSWGAGGEDGPQEEWISVWTL